MRCLIALIYFFGQCNGNFFMIYKEKGEVISLTCKRDGWQMDLDQDNKIDCYSNVINTNIACKNVSLSFQLEKEKSGFFACVNFRAEAQTTPWLFPFKPEDQVDLYIVALMDPNLTSAGTITNSVSKITGETVHLPCNFTMPVKKSHNMFWIKTSSDKKSSCLHSYSLGSDYSEHFDFHCLIDENVHNRLSTSKAMPWDSPTFHHLTIREVTPADSGQYECVLQVDKKWKVITNITVTVDMKDTKQTAGGKPLLFAMVALVFFCLFITAIVIVLRQTEWLSKGSQSTGIKRDENGESDPNSECSPYEVGRRDEEIYSLANLPEGGYALVCAPISDQEALDLNPIRINSTLYDASSQIDTETSSELEPHYESVT